MSDLFIAPPPRRVIVERTTPEGRRALFQKFHADNPHVYEKLVAMARELVGQGHRRIGIRMLWEACRWSLMRTNVPANAPKLNDWLTPHYSRLIQQRERDLVGVFETREREP